MEVELKENTLYEAVFSFKTPSGFYATPLGFRRKGGFIYVKTYRSTRTHKYLMGVNEVVLNIVYNPYVYLYTAFKDETDGLNKVSFHVGNDGLPRIKGSLAHIVLRKMNEECFEDYCLFTYLIERIEKSNETIEPYSRCFGLTIEALVYLTKLKHIPGSTVGFENIVNYLNNVLATLNRLCRDGYYGELVEEIMVLNKQWRGES